MGTMRLIATYVGPHGTTTCSQCREQLEPGERIFGDADAADIYCLRCAHIDGPDDRYRVIPDAGDGQPAITLNDGEDA